MDHKTKAGALAASACAFDYERYAQSLSMLTDGYSCPLCRDMGFVLKSDNLAYPCSCRPIVRTLSMLRRQGLEQSARAMTFFTFDAESPWQQKMLDAALAFVCQPSPGWLFFGGQSGCGKTHLGTAAAVCLALAGRELLYMPWTRSSMRLKALSVDDRRDDALRAFIDAPVLYIDDLFKSPPTEADKHIAFEILSARYARSDRITILSSERTLSDLIAIDEALAGRIAERCGREFLISIARDTAKNHRFAGML